MPCVFLDRFSYLQQRDQRRGESRLFCTLWVLVPSDEGFLDGPHFLLRQMIAPLDLSPDNAFEALHCTSARPRTSHLINQSNRDLNDVATTARRPAALGPRCGMEARSMAGRFGGAAEPVGGAAGSPFFTQDFAELASRTIDKWHVPGTAISVVDRGDVWADVRPSVSSRRVRHIAGAVDRGVRRANLTSCIFLRS